jgi:transcriptional regulator with GAF, ATPase, and Fis domain
LVKASHTTEQPVDTLDTETIPSSLSEDKIVSSLQEMASMDRYFKQPISAKELPERILRVAMDCLEAGGGTVLLIDKKGWLIEAKYSNADGTSDLQHVSAVETVEKGLAGWVLKTQRAALVENTLEDERWLSRKWEVEEKRARSAISVPLRSRSRTYGVLTLVKEDNEKYSDDDLAMLSTLSTVLNMHSERIPEILPS